MKPRMTTAGAAMVLAGLALAAVLAQHALFNGGDAPTPGGSPSPAPTSSSAACGRGQPVHDALIVKVTDGDTVHAVACGADITVRVIGLDTPETKKPATPVQCYGPEASRFAGQQLFSRRAELIPDRRAGFTDKYGRWLYVIEVGGQDYAETAIRAGSGRPASIEWDGGSLEELPHGAPLTRGGELVAGRRDATFLLRADTRRHKVNHVLVVSRTLRIGRGVIGPAAACNPSYIMLCEETYEPVSQAHPGGRCQRNGCRQRWPAAAG